MHPRRRSREAGKEVVPQNLCVSFALSCRPSSKQWLPGIESLQALARAALEETEPRARVMGWNSFAHQPQNIGATETQTYGCLGVTFGVPFNPTLFNMYSGFVYTRYKPSLSLLNHSKQFHWLQTSHLSYKIEALKL